MKKGKWMVAIGFAAFFASVLACPPILISSAHPNPDEAAGRSIGAMRKDARAFATRSRKAKTDEELSRAVVDLCRLHREVVADTRFGKSRELQGIQAQLRQRLRTIQTAVKNKIARAERTRKKQLSAAGLRDDQTGQASSPDQPSAGDFDYLADQISRQMAFANQLTGGPSQVFAYASGNWAGPPDNGPELVRLIEETINPEFWERNGGPGRIRYYKPLMIIVVTGSMEVHSDLNRMLRTLRSISR